MEPDARLGPGDQHIGGVGSPAVRRQEGQVSMVFPEVGAQGLVELRRHRANRIEGVIEGSLVRVPRALVRHTLYRVLE